MTQKIKIKGSKYFGFFLSESRIARTKPVNNSENSEVLSIRRTLIAGSASKTDNPQTFSEYVLNCRRNANRKPIRISNAFARMIREKPPNK